MRSSKAAGTQLWVWGVLLVAKLAVINSAASVGPFPIVSLWWVWVAVSVVRWAVISSDASVGQVTRLEANGWALVIVVGELLLMLVEVVGGAFVIVDGEFLLVVVRISKVY
jgi:hypothetical protein